MCEICIRQDSRSKSTRAPSRTLSSATSCELVLFACQHIPSMLRHPGNLEYTFLFGMMFPKNIFLIPPYVQIWSGIWRSPPPPPNPLGRGEGGCWRVRRGVGTIAAEWWGGAGGRPGVTRKPYNVARAPVFPYTQP